MSLTMIAVDEAKKIILSHACELNPVKLPLTKAAGLTLAENIYASISIPAYPQSSMDGYAFAFDAWDKASPLTIEGVMAAGTNLSIQLAPGVATRIFTGAALPEGADTVVMQEKTKTNEGQLNIHDGQLQKGMNVRAQGSEIHAGELAAVKDTLLTPALVGFLAGIGVDHVMVFPLPRISIIVTGNELQQPGEPLLYGKVYESNSYSLKAALKQIHLDDVAVYTTEDTLDAVMNVLTAALEQSDTVFLTGGVSVGDYDFVELAAEKIGVEKVFHKIRQRPGKPLFFGKKDSKLIFGLPGNPASVLTCFYEYVEPAIRKMIRQQSAVRILKAPLKVPFKKTPGLTHFLKGYYDGSTVMPLHAQESYRLSSFANANCLIKIEEGVTSCEQDQPVEIHLLPA